MHFKNLIRNISNLSCNIIYLTFFQKEEHYISDFVYFLFNDVPFLTLKVT